MMCIYPLMTHRQPFLREETCKKYAYVYTYDTYSDGRLTRFDRAPFFWSRSDDNASSTSLQKFFPLVAIPFRYINRVASSDCLSISFLVFASPHFDTYQE